MSLLALDASLTSTGWAIGGEVGTFSPPGTGVERLVAFREWLSGVVATREVETAVVEGYSFGSRGRAVFSIGELGGVLRVTLFDLGVRVVEVPPSTLKKYATGKGNASKEKVLVEAVKRLGYAGASTDEADALWLLEIGRAGFGLDATSVPKAHSAALEGVEWPEAA